VPCRHAKKSINFIHTPAGWVLPFCVLEQGSGLGGKHRGSILLEDAKAAIVHLAGDASVKDAVLKELGALRIGVLPAELADVCSALHERKELENKSIQLASAEHRRIFWLSHIQLYSPLVAIAAGRFLSAHVTSCATERNWSFFGNIFFKTRNRLHLEKAQKLAFIRANSSLGQAGGLDEEIRLSLIDLVEGGEEEEEEM